MSDTPALVVESRDALAEALAAWLCHEKHGQLLGRGFCARFCANCLSRAKEVGLPAVAGVVTVAPGPALPDVDALAEALCENRRPGRGPCAAHRVTAEAVLATGIFEAWREQIAQRIEAEWPVTGHYAARTVRATALTPKGPADE